MSSKTHRAEILLQQGNQALLKGNLSSAKAAYKSSLKLNPRQFHAYLNLGAVLKMEGHFREAIDTYTKGLVHHPNNARLWNSVGLMHEELGEIEPSRIHYQKATALDPENSLWRLHLDSLWPVAMDSNEEIDRHRAELEASLHRYGESTLKNSPRASFEELPAQNARPPFALAYQNRIDLPIRHRFADVVRSTLPPFSVKRHLGEKPHVGFVVTEGHEGIFVNLMKGMLENFSFPDLRYSLICSYPSAQFFRKVIQNPSIDYVIYPHSFAETLKVIHHAQLDLLYFWEISTDPRNYYLPFYRLAHLQCTSWGFPVTTGMKEVDFFLSTEYLTDEENAGHYSETLIRLRGLPCYYYRPNAPSPLKTRKDFGFPDKTHLYLCTQSLFKFHPDFDSILGEILRCDPAGNLVLLESPIGYVKKMILERFRRSIPDVLDRIIFVPRLEKAAYLNLIALADVMLDSYSYGGGATSAEGIGLNVPVLTLPSRFCSGLMTLAFYKKIGVLDCVVSSPDEYVRKSVMLGTDRNYREEIKEKIKEASDALFEDNDSVRALEEFFLQAISKSRQSLP